MIYPSIDALLTKIDSKYSIVTIAAQRARALQENEELESTLKRPTSNKRVGIALEEMYEGHLTIKKD